MCLGPLPVNPLFQHVSHGQIEKYIARISFDTTAQHR